MEGKSNYNSPEHNEIDRMVFLKVGWMKYYQGLENGDKIVGAGRMIKDLGWGGEIFNFKSYSNELYGCAQTSESALVSKYRLEGESNSTNAVTIVWVSPSPYRSGVYIIGWYRNATIYNKRRYLPKSAGRYFNKHPIEYYITTSANYGTLLPENQREFRIPVKKGWMGAIPFVFYADKNYQHRKFRIAALDYINRNQNNNVQLYIDDEIAKTEGDPVVRRHVSYERNPNVIRLAKQLFIDTHGVLFCEICKFDFQKEYGKLGADFIEAHHTIPLNQIKRATVTKPQDLMMVCRNCHHMVHRLISLIKNVSKNDALKLKQKDWTSKFIS